MEWKKKIRYQSKYIVNILHYLTRNIFYYAHSKNYYDLGVTKIVFRQVKTYDAPTNYTNRHIYADLYSNSDLIETVEIVVFQAYGDVANKIISTWTSK